MEYKLTDHLGSTRMSYKLNFTFAGVYQNATIQYLADYYSFGKIVREYINAGTTSRSTSTLVKSGIPRVGMIILTLVITIRRWGGF